MQFNNQNKTPNFLLKLFSILQNDSLKDIIFWSPKGDSFEITNLPSFRDKILQMHFKHSNFENFVRQLNLYGFKKVRGSNKNIEFRHENLTKNGECLNSIKRKPSDQNWILVMDERNVVGPEIKKKPKNEFPEQKNQISNGFSQESNNISLRIRAQKEFQERLNKIEKQTEKLEKLSSILLAQNNMQRKTNKMLLKEIQKNRLFDKMANLLLFSDSEPKNVQNQYIHAKETYKETEFDIIPQDNQINIEETENFEEFEKKPKDIEEFVEEDEENVTQEDEEEPETYKLYLDFEE